MAIDRDHEKSERELLAQLPRALRLWGKALLGESRRIELKFKVEKGYMAAGDSIWTRRPFNVWAVRIWPSEVILSIYEGKKHVEKVGRLGEFKPSGRTAGYSERVVYEPTWAPAPSQEDIDLDCAAILHAFQRKRKSMPGRMDSQLMEYLLEEDPIW